MIKIELEQKCHWCYDGTDHSGNEGPVPCTHCEGVGKMMTESGEEILEFVRRRLKLAASPEEDYHMTDREFDIFLFGYTVGVLVTGGLMFFFLGRSKI